MNTTNDIDVETVYQDKQITHQILEQNSAREASPSNTSFIWSSIRTLQIGQQLQDELCEQVIVAPSIKVIVFTNAGRTSLCSRHIKKLFGTVDIEIAEYHNEESLFGSIISNPATTYFFIINSLKHVQHLADRAHPYSTVRSIYVHCETPQLVQQRRLARNYSKLNAVFGDPLRLLIKLTMDLGLFCQETADRQKDDASLIEAARRNYQRSIDLYAFAETMV